MNHPHDIDNEEQLFPFDSCDQSYSSHFTPLSAGNAGQNPLVVEINDQLLSRDAPSTSEEAFMIETHGKGKSATKPLSIRAPAPIFHDSFDVPASNPSTSCDSFWLTPLDPSQFDQVLYHEVESQFVSRIIRDQANASVASLDEGSPWKGKQKEIPPVLPPLNFSPTGFSYAPSISSTLQSLSPGPSSYASGHDFPMSSITTSQSDDNERDESLKGANLASSPARSLFFPSGHIPSRPRSLSSLSLRSDRSFRTLSMSHIKSKLKSSRTTNLLARKVMFQKLTDAEATTNAKTFNSEHISGDSSPTERWHTGLKVDELDAAISRLSHPRLQDIGSQSPDALLHTASPLKHKGRSHSSPYPFSALDIVPITSNDTFLPFPLVIENYFDELLPHEIQLHIFKTLLTVHEEDHFRATREGRWTFAKSSSSRNKWVGRNRGLREVVKLSRVSKSWQALAFDGQLWSDLDLHAFPDISDSFLLRLTTASGQYTKELDISGNARISATTFIDLSDNFCVNRNSELDTLCHTQLTSINLQGCTSLTTRSVHHLLMCCCLLERLCVKGLAAVTNTTLDILSTHCLKLTSLDASRCQNIDAKGIKAMGAAFLERGARMLLRELRVSGLKYIDDDTMSILGQATPFLEVLDLSYVHHLHNSAIDAFVACDDEEEWEDSQTILVSSRDIGREVSEEKLRRRVTRLRHLSMSYCPLLTDDACSNLTFCVPDLEFLELAGIGANLGDNGIVRLLGTTPHIRRLDFEDATHITDAVLVAITPGPDVRTLANNVVSRPGHALEHLNVSFASDITDDAFLSLIRACTHLKHLEADNTRISNSVLKEFVRECRKRKVLNAKAVTIDCRSVSESTVKDLHNLTRPRMGWRAFEARKLAYLDARDDNAEELKVGQDECDETRVVLKSFYSWQTVDAVKVAREKRRKASRRRMNGSSSDDTDSAPGRSLRWWTPGGRRTSRSAGGTSPNFVELNNDGCRTM